MNIVNNINNNFKNKRDLGPYPLWLSFSWSPSYLIYILKFFSIISCYFAYYKSLFKNNELCRMYKPSYTTFADPFTYEISTLIKSSTFNFIQLYRRSLYYWFYSHFEFNHWNNVTRTLKNIHNFVEHYLRMHTK